MKALFFFLLLFPFPLIIPAVITLGVPRRYFGFYAAWVVMLAAMIAVLPSGRDHSGMDSSLLGFVGLCVFAIVAARGIFILTRPPPDKPFDPAPIAWSATGALTAACAVMVFSQLVSTIKPAWVAHMPALLMLAAALIAVLRSRRISSSSFGSFAFGLVVSAALTSVVTGIVVGAGINRVITAAEAIAGDRPYCIQVVATRPEFVPATARFDFSPITMQTPCARGWCWQNHAILVLDGAERKLMNWSHRSGTFRDDVLNVSTRPPAVVCRPVPHFAPNLPLF